MRIDADPWAPPAPVFLAVFLNDHLAAAAGGRALAVRAARAVAPSPYRAALEAAAGALADQHAAFRRLLAGHGLTERRGKQWLAVAGERAGRLKLNGKLLRPSPLSRLVELEGVLLSLEACRQAWSALAEAGVAAEEADAAVRALDARVDELEAHRPAVARAALTG
jgi:hypothetical protein